MRRFGHPRFSGRSAAPADRTANPRAPGWPSSPAGNGAAGFVNPFISAHVPMLWNALTAEYGRAADYWPDGEVLQRTSITIIWKEGAEDEVASPGRYSRALVQNSDLPRPPQQGDVLTAGGATYDVVRVNAMPYGMSSIVLQDRDQEAD